MPDPLFGARAALVLLLALLVGLAAGGLDFASYHSLPHAVLVGGGAVGASLLIFNKIIGR